MKIWTHAGILILLGLACAGCASTPTGPAPEEFHRPPANPFEEAFSHQEGVQPIRWAGWIKTSVAGTGASPSVEDKVVVNYRGKLTDGTEFDSSYARGKPSTFALSNVIPCWTNGLTAMKVGGKAELVCPASAAYGDAGSPPKIPGGATLVFEIELVDVVK
jgi:FKBP-type peptidyl-prolyl cis-trans isomerase FkpA